MVVPCAVSPENPRLDSPSLLGCLDNIFRVWLRPSVAFSDVWHLRRRDRVARASKLMFILHDYIG